MVNGCHLYVNKFLAKLQAEVAVAKEVVDSVAVVSHLEVSEEVVVVEDSVVAVRREEEEASVVVARAEVVAVLVVALVLRNNQPAVAAVLEVLNLFSYICL